MVSLVVDPSTLVMRENGPATGCIWFKFGEVSFPAEEWNDFVVVVLGWWTGALVRLLTVRHGKEVLDFMDGPYAIEVAVSGGERVLVFRALEGTGRIQERLTGVRPLREFVAELLDQSRRIIAIYRKRGKWSDDAETLLANMTLLKG